MLKGFANSHGDLSGLPRDGHDGAAKEVAKAYAEGGQRQAGNVLVGAERHGQHAVNQSAKHGQRKRADQRQQSGHQHVGIFHPVFIQESRHQAANAAHVHDAGNAEVQIAAFFGEDFTRRAIQQGNALNNRVFEEGG